MASKIRIRALMNGDVAQVKALIRHPMETGRRKDEQGNSIPAHFITEVEATVGDRTLMTARWGAAVSQNPFLGFRVKGVQPGDELIIRYVDNQGETGQGSAIIK